MFKKYLDLKEHLASKNINRNKKRYRITVFSIVISVVLFVTFKSFVDMALNINGTVNESQNIHFVVKNDYQVSDKPVAIDDSITKNISALKLVSSVYKQYELNSFYCAINKNSETKAIKDMKTVYFRNVKLNNSEKSIMMGGIETYDKASLEASKKYLEAGRIDEATMNKENGIIIIDKNHVYDRDTKKTYIGAIGNFKVGDEIDLQHISIPDIGFNSSNVKKAKVVAILKDDPFSYLSQDENKLKIITTEEVSKSLMGVSEIKPTGLNITIKNIKNENAAKGEIEGAIKSNPALMVVDSIESNRNGASGALMVEILIYGFVVVVSLIGSVNIINTLTTNIILRKREFAMLKSIGLTQKGLKKMITLEGILYGIVGTIYGSIIGTGLSYLMYKFLNAAREFTWSIPWTAIAIAGTFSIVIGYVSVISPLARIEKENLIEVIREDS